ncbi:MAG: dockerin type I repeat-containing protein, partial [Bacilli bacterium]|nr:dockerin type I repeat-containing protein [Bacilli bacterium]
AQTQAEWDFVKANVATETSLTGLMKSGSLLSWSNGTVAGDFVELNLIPPYDGHVIFEPGWSVTEFGGSARNFIIELPGNISTDQMYSALDAFLEAGLNRRISNSAFLNDFNSTDLNYWFRIAAPGINNVNTSLYMKSIGLGGNYWGTTDPVLVNRQIVDFDDYQELWDINEGDILLTPPETAFPFVSDVYVLNNLDEVVSTVGSETIQVVVEFNRDMDITVPLTVRFGSEKPYADHQIPGSYETPRKWIGTFHLSTTMENGNQYFLIENGHALGDSWFALQPDRGRFTFEIDTTGAQAMVMQGQATETGISLTWMQDDFETLAGYNVYRSEAIDGYYQRLNQVVIPADVKTFFDDSVEPGVMYYYNFTVVKTDLTESVPSGKIVIMSLDTMAPNIYHTPVYQAYTGSNQIIAATITDNLMIQEAYLYYRVVGDLDWSKTLMYNNNDRYSAIIPAENVTLAGLEYYIEAYDGVSYTNKGSDLDPYLVTVIQSVDQNDLGDVNGDGQITVLDALMVLQAINDRLNLDQEAFLRADLDGSGNLEAWEALRILQYVNGNVTTIV